MYSQEVLSYGGRKICTTLDTRVQNFFQEAVQQGLTDLDQQFGNKDYELSSDEEKQLYLQASRAGCHGSPKGKKKALVSGRDFAFSPLDRGTSNNRLPGAFFNPLVYLAAIDGGRYAPVSIVNDSAVTFKFDNQQWSPLNLIKNITAPLA